MLLVLHLLKPHHKFRPGVGTSSSESQIATRSSNHQPELTSSAGIQSSESLDTLNATARPLEDFGEGGASAQENCKSQHDQHDNEWTSQMRPVSTPVIRVGPTVRLSQADGQIFDTMAHIRLTHAVGPAWARKQEVYCESTIQDTMIDQMDQLELVVFYPQLDKVFLCKPAIRKEGYVEAIISIRGGEVFVAPVVVLDKSGACEIPPGYDIVPIPQSIRRRFLLRFTAYRPRCGVVADSNVLVRIWLCLQTPEQLQLCEELELANRKWGSVQCGPFHWNDEHGRNIEEKPRHAKYLPSNYALAVGLGEVLTVEMDGLYGQTRWRGGG